MFDELKEVKYFKEITDRFQESYNVNICDGALCEYIYRLTISAIKAPSYMFN